MTPRRTIARCIIDGPCPFLTCLKQTRHEHELCETCGAVRHGNFGCAACRKYHGVIIPQDMTPVGEAP